jgi:para-nitrobenzyl esterase
MLPLSKQWLRKGCTPVIAATVLLFGGFAQKARAADQVKTASGGVEGTRGQSPEIRAFKGIPFAAPPVGDLRWKPPQPVAKWKAVRPAREFGARCMQASVFQDMIFRSNGMGEDCLYLNVWTPAKSSKEHLPVLLYIYGGGFQAGDSSEGRYDGESLARKGIVFVSMNYRLGVFGFLAHSDLTKESSHHASGNYGLMDQAEALRWVQKNISAFGGDPRKITVGGESAGSFSVSALMASPLSRDMVAGGIGESGAFFSTTLPAKPLAAAEEDGAKFLSEAGTTIAALRAMPAPKLLETASKAGPFRFSPCTDGYFFPEPPASIYAEGKQSHVPLLAGWNADEATFQVLFAKDKPTPENVTKQIRTAFNASADEALAVYPASTADAARQSAKDLAGDQFIAFSTWKWLEMQSDTGGKPVYRYFFTRPRPTQPGAMLMGVPASEFGAPHASEIEYALGNLASNKVYSWQPEDQKVSDLMQGYWANFVKSGDPNGPGLPKWPVGDKANNYQVMRLDVNPGAAPDPHRARYQFLDRFYAKQVTK